MNSKKGSLVLGVSEGFVFYVGDVRCEVFDITSMTSYKIKVTGAVMDSIYEIGNKVGTEILPKVFVSVGVKHRGQMTVVIQAPRNLLILREPLYKKGETISESIEVSSGDSPVSGSGGVSL